MAQGEGSSGRRREVAGAELRGGGVAGESDRGVAGPYLGRGLAQEHRSGMGSALGCLGRRCRAGSMALDGEAALGGEARRSNPFGGLQGLRPTQNQHQRGLEGVRKLTGARARARSRAGGPAAKTGGGGGRRSWTWVMQSSSGFGSLRDDALSRCEGGTEVRRAQGLPAARNRERELLTGGGGWLCFEHRQGGWLRQGLVAAAGRGWGREGRRAQI